MRRKSSQLERLEALKERALEAKFLHLQARIAHIQRELRMAKYIASVYEEAENETNYIESDSMNRRELLGHRQASFRSLDDFFEHQTPDHEFSRRGSGCKYC